VRALGLLATALLLLLAFTLTSSLAGLVSASPWWMLAAGVALTVALPALVASWLRALRARRAGATASGRRGPSTMRALVVVNLLVLVACALASGATRRAVRAHGSWWVARIARLLGKPASPVIATTDALLGWLTDLLPGQSGQPAQPRPRQGDGGVAARALEAGRPADGDRARRPDSGARADVGATGSGGVTVAFERRGSGIVVPVTLVATAGTEVRVRMLLDTGASITTIDDRTLRGLGQMLPSDSPSIQTQTANGVVRRNVTVIEGAEVGAARVRGGLTVSLCEPCAAGEVVGLLGLNWARHFTVTIDHDGGRVVLTPKPGGGERLSDILPFVELGDAKGLWRGPLLSVECQLVSRAPRALRNLRVAAVVKEGAREGRIWTELKALPARGRVQLKLQGLPPVKAESFALRLEQAEW
jgi:predicted aspartyl protease